jgi:hypothetical protein
MPTGATDLGFDVVAQQPKAELNYRVFVDTSGTEASLASIHAVQQEGGGAHLVFSTDAADGPLTQRMLIDAQGNIGIGIEKPKARLDVAGDARFERALAVQGTLTASEIEISGSASINGNLSVTGMLVAPGASGTFNNLVAKRLELKNPNGEEDVKIDRDGTIASPMWRVTSIYVNEQAIPTPFFPDPEQTICPTKPFSTGGGTLLIFASGSGAAASGIPGPITIGMDLFVDNGHVGSVLSRVDRMTDSKPFVGSGLVVPNIAPGSHTLSLKTAAATTVGLNDFFNVTILELPF